VVARINCERQENPKENTSHQRYTHGITDQATNNIQASVIAFRFLILHEPTQPNDHSIETTIPVVPLIELAPQNIRLKKVKMQRNVKSPQPRA
jgi:hypothetical protein